MDLPEISSFIDHWHKAVCESLEDQEEITELPALKESLKEAVRDPSKPIRRLATSPLLCAMICAMHRDRRRQLPDDRIELYEAGCQMLLERRDIERGVLLREYPTLKYRQKRLLLDELAYWMIKNDVSEVDLDRVSERFSQRLPNMSDVHKDVAGEDVVRLFVERSGIVREPVRGRLDFAHRTFQEYMAARNALDEDDLGLLVRNAHNDQWREVIILAVGQATPKQREMLILGLIKRGGKERGCRHQLYLLAVACLEVTVELSPPVKAKVIGRMKQIVPPKTLTEAKQLANAGELAVPLLRYSPNLARTTSACVRTLALIGTDSAIETLRGYAADGRECVRQELVKAASGFDPSLKYFARVLSNWTTLDMPKATASLLEGIATMTHLRHLVARDGRFAALPEAVTGLTELRTLDLGENRLESLPESFGRLKNLTWLDLSHNKLRSLPRSFGQLRSLKRLALEHELRSLPLAIGKLRNLEEIVLWGSAIALSDRLRALLRSPNWGSPPFIRELTAELKAHVDLAYASGDFAVFHDLRHVLFFLDRPSRRKLSEQEARGMGLPGRIGLLMRQVFERAREVDGRTGDFLPPSFTELAALRILFIKEGCLSRLPDGFGKLANLQRFMLLSSHLATLPDSFGRLRSLEEFTLLTNRLVCLPGSFGQLARLRKLNLYAPRLTSFPESFQELANLEEVHICTGEMSDLIPGLRLLKNIRVLGVPPRTRTKVRAEFRSVRPKCKIRSASWPWLPLGYGPDWGVYQASRGSGFWSVPFAPHGFFSR